jgi:hypothetical protein
MPESADHRSDLRAADQAAVDHPETAAGQRRCGRRSRPPGWCSNTRKSTSRKQDRRLRKAWQADTPLRDHDRVEIYRPLIADPKEVRKQRAAEGKVMKKGAGDNEAE